MAREHLHSQHDVIVPQFLGRLEFVLALQQLIDDISARFVENHASQRPMGGRGAIYSTRRRP